MSVRGGEGQSARVSELLSLHEMLRACVRVCHESYLSAGGILSVSTGGNVTSTDCMSVASQREIALVHQERHECDATGAQKVPGRAPQVGERVSG